MLMLILLFLICRHFYTSLPRSKIILIVVDGAILLSPHVIKIFGRWTDDVTITDTDDGDLP